jgi:hypothetical protein
MSKKLIYLFSFIFGLGLILTSIADAADPNLVGWWKLDETSGLTAADSSVFGNDGTLPNMAGNEWTNGTVGGALEFDGTDDYVSVPNSSSLQLTSALTMAGWIKADSWGSGTDVDIIARKGEDNPNNYQLSIADGLATLYLDDGDGSGYRGDTLLNTGQWYHIAATWDGTTVRIYVDGVLDNDPPDLHGDNISTDTRAFYIGGRSGADLLDGILDDIRIYNRALSEAEIKNFVTRPKAWNPNPTDGVLYEDTWASLSWSPGDFALSHDVYFGDNFDDVNDGAESTFQGNQASAFFVVGFPGMAFPDGLVPGTTYYWRVDDVEADGTTIHKGNVWSFMVPPKTAYAPDPADGAELVEPDVELSWTGGFGTKLHYVYFGDNFDDVNSAAGGLPLGLTTYTPGLLKLAKTYYWRVDEFDGIATYKGHVWSFTTLGGVGSPDPSNSATDVKHTQILKWSAGDNAASHEVYFGTDKDAVRNANTGSPEYKGSRDLDSESYDPGMLEWDTTYYWRIDEVNNVHPDSPWVGLVWTFTTGSFLAVDDFESYNDIDPPEAESNRIFEAWPDGYEIPTNGALVGNEFPPYAEQSIVHGGIQSMPYIYDNSVGNSEATHTLEYPRDWTEKGVDTLTLWFRGEIFNSPEQMYVVLNGSAVVYHDNPEAVMTIDWMEWNIELQEFANQGVNLTDVNTIGIGFGDRSNPQAGGSGTMYFDDIRLYPPPTEPEAP